MARSTPLWWTLAWFASIIRSYRLPRNVKHGRID